MRKLWTDPQNSLRPEDLHNRGRAHIPHLLLAVIQADPSTLKCVRYFQHYVSAIHKLTKLSVIDLPGDLTVSVLSRMFMHAAGFPDFVSLCAALTSIISEGNSTVYEYRQAHPAPSHLFDSFLRGVPDRSFSRFFDFISKQLPRLPTYELAELCGLLLGLCRTARWRSESETSFITFICKRSSSLFSYLFAVLRNPGMVKPTDGHVTHPFIPSILALAAVMLNRITHTWTEQTQPFLRICGRARLFEGLEVSLVHSQNWSHTLGTHPSCFCTSMSFLSCLPADVRLSPMSHSAS